jgi:AcrR family transcriptional regulator
VTTSGIGRRRSAAQNDSSNTSYQRRRLEIIEAAGHVFKRKGFQGASLGDIAEHLGTDRANLYYYVGSKEELLEAAVTEAVLENLEHARSIRSSDLSTPEKIRTLVIDLMASYEKHFPFIYVFIQENLNHVAEGRSEWAQKMKQVNRDYEAVITGMIEDGFADGTLKQTAPAWVTAYGIIGLVGWTNRWYDPTRMVDGVDAAAIGAAYADMVVSGIVA